MRGLFLIAVLGAAGWFAPQMMEGTDGACTAFERRLQAVLPGDPGVARAAAAQAARALAQFPYGGGCVVGWWRMLIDPPQGAETGR